MGALEAKEYYTYEEWLEVAVNDPPDSWTELYDGKIFLMATPTTEHQRVSTNLILEFASYLRGKTCEVFHTPFAVRLNKKKDTAFLPDILVICDPSKLTKNGCDGAPDLIIEILSPSTSKWDKVTKFKEYLKAGVREYWIVDPEDQIIWVHTLKNSEYVTSVYHPKDTITVHILPELNIDLAQIFEGETS